MEKLNKLGKSLKNFTYTDKEIADEIYSAINSTQFLGISVRINSRLNNCSARYFETLNTSLIFNIYVIHQ